MTARPAGPGLTRAQWRVGWRADEHEQAVREALTLGDPAEALARACAALRSEHTKRARRNPRAGSLIATRLAAALLATANSLHDLTPPGPRGDLTPGQLLDVFSRALDTAAQEGGHHGFAS